MQTPDSDVVCGLLGETKHPCPDCRFCQWCSDDRCRLCRATTTCRKQLSLAEQVALYEQLNGKGERP